MPWKAFFAACMLLIGTSLGAAQDYPNRPIQVVVPYTPGGTADVITRAITERLSASLGQPITVDNRPGASGNVGAAYVAQAAPDGYTLLVHATTIGTFPLIFPKLGYDPLRDFAIIGSIGESPNLFVVKGDSEIKSLADLVALAKRKPGGINVGTGGAAGPGHLAIEHFARLNGFKITHVAYRGVTPAAADLMAGSIDAASLGLGGILGQLQSGHIRALAVASSKRSALAPDIPTTREAGFTDVNGGVRYIFAAPAKTPAAIIDRLSKELNRALDQPTVQEALKRSGNDVFRSTPSEAQKMIEEQQSMWAPVIKELGLKLN